MVGIYGPNGVLLTHTRTTSRVHARKAFASETGEGVKWGHLWLLGYRCRRVPSSPDRRQGERRGSPASAAEGRGG